MKDWLRIINRGTGSPVEVLIYDQIGKDWFEDSGVNAKEFADELKGIPQNRDILLRINSPGGNVHDGLAIHNMLSRRRGHVDVVVDGVAASIASVIALSGRSLSMPKNSLMMIHDPSGVVMGTSADMRKMADVLDTHRDSIAGIYADYTGKPRDEINNLMAEETWMDGIEAVSNGFATVIEDDIQIAACFDFSGFRRVPAALRNQNQKAAADAVANEKDKEMKLRDRIIALLQGAGIAVDDKSTDDQLFAQFEQAGTELKDNTKIKDEVQALRDEVANLKPTPVEPQNVVDRSEFDQLKAAYETERKARITNEVNAVCVDRPFLKHDAVLARVLKDESYLDEVKSMPAQQAGTEPVRAIQGANESVLEKYRNIKDSSDKVAFWRANKPAIIAEARN